MPFVNQRWLGGMLTNFSTVYKRLQRLKELEEIDFNDVAGSGMTKKELLHLRREHDKLDRTLGGIRDMARVPSAIWVVDTKKEHIAVNEARKLGIPVVAILDTNCDPDEVNYPIPGNDDAIRSVALLTRVVADAVAEGLIARAGAASADEKPAGNQLGTEEPLAEWERELLEGSAAASPAATVVPIDESIVAAAEVEGADDLAITSGSAQSSGAIAAEDEADDLEGLAQAADETRGDAEAAAAEATTAADAATTAADAATTAADAATTAAAAAAVSAEAAADEAAAEAEATDEAPLTETIGEITDAVPAEADQTE
jgi:small subunit ribosomal protein S2